MISNFFSPRSIIPQLRGTDGASVIQELSDLLAKENRFLNPANFLRAVLARESLNATAMSPGWALPHARIAGLPHIVFAVGRSANPLAWFGHHGDSVHVVFLFAVPERDSGAYLSLISGLARFSQNEALVRKLRDAPDALAISELLESIPVRADKTAAGGR